MKSFFKSKITNPVFVCILACFCCLLWGSAFPVIKIGYKALDISSADYMSQILFAGVRFTVSGILTLVMGAVLTKSAVKVGRKGLYKIPVLSLFQTILQYLFFYIGLAKTTGTKGSIVNSTSVFFSVIIASLFLKQEKLTVKKGIGCMLGFAGAVAVNLTSADTFGDMSFLGEGFIVLSALSYAISSVLIKLFSKSESPVALSGWQFLFGGIVMIITGLIFGGRLHFESMGSVLIVLYLALLSAVAYTLWGILLKYNKVSGVTVYSFMTPVFGCVLSALLLNEGLLDNAVKTIVALALVCFGIFLVNKEKKYEGKNDTRQGI